MAPHTIILEEASLEFVPRRFWGHESCKTVEARTGVPPQSQILDDNFHHKIIATMTGNEKKGRPDIIHFALLDIVSTPAYLTGLIRPIIRTVNGEVIVIKEGVRLPRTQLRFEGVMSKILKNDLGPGEAALFELLENQSIGKLLQSLSPSKVLCLSIEGIFSGLNSIVKSLSKEQGNSYTWIVGGFARGHFSEEVKTLTDQMISISSHPLPAHVVTARLSYEIERAW